MTSDTELSELTDDAITKDFRILQRRRGHRYSLDDVMTAYVAASTCPTASTYLDMGCGIGSVLLMVSYCLPSASVTGVEAQEISFAIASKNVARNGLSGRVSLLHGDLREVVPTLSTRFDLVTGTPPYLPRGTAIESPDPQRAAARVELRGGVEDYLAAAASVLADDGRFVVCADARRPDRVLDGARRAGLLALRCCEVIPREGAQPLFSVWTLRHRNDNDLDSMERVTHVERDASGARTHEANEARRLFGLDAGA